jgi:ribosomal protein S18 acetylase RimI-like enzyme
MSSLRLRELRADDAEAVAALFTECYGEARAIDAKEIRSWLGNAEFEPDWLRVLDQRGEIVGYGDIWPQERDLALDVAAPGCWDVFCDWAETSARERAIPRVRISPPADHELARVCRDRGYVYWRSSFTMEIELDDEIPGEPVFPEGFALTTYRDTDEERLIATLNEAFGDDPLWEGVTPPNFREFYLRSRGFDPALWHLAWDGGELAGFVLGYDQHGADDSLGWVGTLGVRAPWRRRGLGEALLRTAFRSLFERGLRRVGLGVDPENVTGALDLYERVGMHKTQQTDHWVLDL